MNKPSFGQPIAQAVAINLIIDGGIKVSINERDVAGIGIVNFTEQVDVSISIVDSDRIEATLTPQPETVADIIYVVSATVDDVPALLQGVSWTAAELLAKAAKTLTFAGLDLAGISKIIVRVEIDPTVVVIHGADVAAQVGGVIPMSLVMASAMTGLAGYIIDTAIVNPAVARFTDVTFPSSFALATHTPDPVSGPMVALQAVDLQQVINKGDVNILLAELQIEAMSVGVTEVLLTVETLDDDSGFRIRSIVRSGTITIS